MENAIELLAIGASAGGPSALSTLLGSLSADIPTASTENGGHRADLIELPGNTGLRIGLWTTAVGGTVPSALILLALWLWLPVIARAWHGKTPREKAGEYEAYLAAAIQKFPTIPGNLGYQLMRIEGGPDGEAYVEFQVISYWESLDAIKAYAGADIRRTRDLPRDKEFLVNMEPLVRNYELRVNAIRP